MKLALGTAQFGMEYGVTNTSGRTNYEEMSKILSLAKENGIKTIDTATSYGDAETKLGKYGISNFKVISKLPSYINIPVDEISEHILNETKQILKRLKVKKLYGLLIHDADEILSIRGKKIFQALEKLKKDNLVEKIGVSIYEPEQYFRVITQYKLDIVQAPLNVFDRRILTSGLIDKSVKLNQEVHIRSIFLQGILLEKTLNENFNKWSNHFQSWFDWLKDNKVTALEVCISFALTIPKIEKIVIGVNRVNQLKQILSIGDNSVNCVPDDLICDDQNLIDPTRWKLK